MAESMGEIANICRFCLSQHELIPISKPTASLFTIQDVEHFTGIQINDVEQLSFVMCESCCKILENSVAFRSACIKNDIIFKQLFSILVESVVDDVPESIMDMKDQSISFESDDQIDTEKSIIDDCSSSANDNEDTERTMQKNISYNNRANSQDPNTTMVAMCSSKNRKTVKRTRPKILCPICGKLVIDIVNHDNARHSKKVYYDCPHCSVKMINRSNLLRHVATVHDKKIIKTCETCGEGFVHHNTYKAHIMAQHGIGKTYECKICMITFNQFANHNRHMNKWHRPAKEYTCNICKKILPSSKSLKNHQRVHSDEQPFACRSCPKRFKSSCARRTHEIVHTGIRFSCELCKRSYRYKSLLAMHYRKDHDDELPSEQNNHTENM
ncbi:zinc finger protein 54-like [Anopheles ziemanni]|uniref:zinc finger protein 54-like n=1 Tax=Anopheles coustani TaxID=139045 RepID=UPI002658B8FB|nr:zinc finger protein 54-like [Anopheles coustani]XP_058170727.1 zinc finger protein 54-like [Anopheles ziemanni]